MSRCTGPIGGPEEPLRRRALFAGRLPPISLGRCPATVTHEFAALGLYVGGRARLELGGPIWTLECGDIVVVPAGQPHRPVDVSRPDIWGLGFHPTLLSTAARGSLLEPFERIRAGASPVVRLASDRQAFVESLFREVARAPDGPSVSVGQSVLTLVMDEVARSTASSAAAAPRGSVVAGSLRFIERHCLGPLTLNQVAAAVGRTPSYVTAALSRATGRSAVQWIIAGRLAEARRCLLHSDETIEGIAERVGYADVTHFIRLFRRAHGATPAAWRAVQRGPRRQSQAAALGALDAHSGRRGIADEHVV